MLNTHAYTVTDEAADWCYEHQATVEFHGIVNGYHRTTVQLPDGSLYGGYGFAPVVKMAMVGEAEKQGRNEVKVHINMEVVESLKKWKDLCESISRIPMGETNRDAKAVQWFVVESEFDRELLRLKQIHDAQVKGTGAKK